MSTFPDPGQKPALQRKKVFFLRGVQLRYVALVAGSCFVLLLFSGFHGVFVFERLVPPSLLNDLRPMIQASTWRLFAVGGIYICVVTLAAVFLSHRFVGPAHRLEEEIRHLSESKDGMKGSLRVREGDELSELVNAINTLISKVREENKS